MDTVHPNSFRHDARLIGVVSLAHSLSHFFQLALPPLFPLLKAYFGVSYAALGAMMGVFYAASGVAQFTSGFVVDRLGARPVLLGGLALLAGGTLCASMAPGFYWLFPIVAIMGIGNGVFHPADFAIINANVAAQRLGHAYSAHGIGGNLGYVLAPLLSFGLGTAFGWRFALAAMGAIGMIGLAVVVWQRALLVSHRAPDAHLQTLKGSMGLFLQTTLLLCFAYFVLQTMAGVGVQTFLPTTLNVGLDLPLLLATSALTAYLVGGMAGILAGGFLAGKTTHHNRVAACGLLACGVLLVAVAALPISVHLIVPMFVLIGFSFGITGPSRDLIVRNATPKGAAGRVYGFVYSGFDVGGTIGPVIFGFLLDHGHARGVFYAIALCLLLAIGTVVRVSHARLSARGVARQPT